MRWLSLLLNLGLLVAVLCVPKNLYAQTSAQNSMASDLERPIHACEKQVANWRQEEGIEILLVITVIVLGCVTSAVQGLKNKWVKGTTVLLGAVTAILAGINSRVFIADDRTLRRAAFEGDAIISELWVLVDTLRDEHVTVQDKVGVRGTYFRKLEEFHAIGAKLNGTSAQVKSADAGRPFAVLEPVHAQSKSAAPVWAQRPPSDNTSLYFVGKSSHASLTSAKQLSMDDALHNAELALRSEAPEVSEAALLDLIKASVVIQDSTFAHDRSTGSYTYYTLLRVRREIQGIGIRSLPRVEKPQSLPTIFQRSGWRPDDLAFDSSSGLFVLDTHGAVSRLVVDQRGSPRIESLFRLEGSDYGYALAANAESVFVASNSILGCTVHRYSLLTKVLSRHLLAVHERCLGIAIDGSTLYVAMPDQNEIRYWDNWDSRSFHSWHLDEIGSPRFLAFDNIGHRLIFAEDSGVVYSMSVPDGRKQLLASNLNDVTSIATSRFHIIVASRGKFSFVARSDNHIENIPTNLKSLPGGKIVGVIVDTDDKLWFADTRLVEGPFPIS